MVRPTPQAAMPLVSVVLTTHRQNPYFADTLASVRAQTWPSWELVVVDDGWDDKDLLRQMVGDGPSTRIVQHAHAGVARSRNHGLAESHGALIAFLDHDDTWRADHLANLVEAIATDPSASASFGQIRMIDREGRTISETHAGPTTLEIVLSGGVRPSMGSLLVRRDHIARVGGFEALLEPADDLDVIYKLAMEGPFVFVDAVTMFYRRHGSNLSDDIVLNAEAVDRMLRLHEVAAKNRGDHKAARLLHDNRIGVKNYWTTEARRRAFRALHSGDRAQARTLFQWYVRFAPRTFARDIGHGSVRKLRHPLARAST